MNCRRSRPERALGPTGQIGAETSSRGTVATGKGVALPRTALAGNPSDGYGGAVLSTTFFNFRAEVEAHAQQGRTEPPSELLDAALRRFVREVEPAAENARLRWRTSIPRAVGLGGSSALVIAALRALSDLHRSQLALDRVAALALAVLLGVAFVLSRTVIGLRIRAVGLSRQAAGHYGVSANRIFLLTLLASGAIAGLGGAFVAAGYFHRFTPGITQGLGFSAILIYLIVRANVPGVLLVSLLFGIVNAGTIGLQTRLGIDPSLANVVQSSIVFALYALQRKGSRYGKLRMVRPFHAIRNTQHPS